MSAPDLTPERDLDRLATTAMAIVTDVRDVDPMQTRDHLAVLCGTEPMRMAQVMMCLAAWVDIDQPVRRLTDRAASITATRTGRAAS